MAKHKVRLDQLLVQRGLAETRGKAQALILAGAVRVGGAQRTKAGEQIAEDAAVELIEALPYASRGGYKLAHALDSFALDPAGLIALDAGASTGGFTDVLLQRGAARVYAVDVGYGLIDWRLRQDPRVVLIKPQFEAGAAQVGKGGVVRDPAVHAAVLHASLAAAAEGQMAPHGLARSPITGPAGNVEFLAWLGGPGPALDVERAIA